MSVPLTSLTTTIPYEGHYNMFEILRPNRTYYFDNIETPSPYIPSFFVDDRSRQENRSSV